jgi:uncharacterized protein (TIGR02284 family)
MTEFKHDRDKDRNEGGGAYADATRPGSTDTLLHDLNKLLRGELSATETYHQALDKISDEYGNDAKFQQLAQMQRDHEQAVRELRGLIERLGGTPSNDSGPWGTWSNTVMGAARLFGDRAALNALQNGEKSGLNDYQDVIQGDRTPDELRHALRPFMTRNQEHIQQLEQMIDAV